MTGDTWTMPAHSWMAPPDAAYVTTVVTGAVNRSSADQRMLAPSGETKMVANSASRHSAPQRSRGSWGDVFADLLLGH